MFSNTQESSEEINTGIYMRAKRQLRSLNWSGRHSRSKRNLTNLAADEIERPWAGLAEWLRVAHSLLDDKTVELPRNADR
jgi:hypothetical protein